MERYKEVFTQILVKSFQEDSTDDDILLLLEELDNIWMKFSAQEAEEADTWGKQAILDWKTSSELVSPRALPLGPSQQKRFDELVAAARGTTEVEFQIPEKQLVALQAIALKKGITVEKLIVDTVEKYLKDKENE